MRPFIYIFILALVLPALLLSCRFDRPLIAFSDTTYTEDGTYTETDSVTHNIIKIRYAKFLCLRNGITIGGCRYFRTFNPKGQLIEKAISKETNHGMCDGNNRFYIKTIYYDTLGRRTKIHCTIRQNYGRGGAVIFERTIKKLPRYNE